MDDRRGGSGREGFQKKKKKIEDDVDMEFDIKYIVEMYL